MKEKIPEEKDPAQAPGFRAKIFGSDFMTQLPDGTLIEMLSNAKNLSSEVIAKVLEAVVLKIANAGAKPSYRLGEVKKENVIFDAKENCVFATVPAEWPAVMSDFEKQVENFMKEKGYDAVVTFDPRLISAKTDSNNFTYKFSLK